ncbi:protein of unknown function [Aminobacter niigataensis]|nr:protein of unknown function [Aminobacter niigataensis]
MEAGSAGRCLPAAGFRMRAVPTAHLNIPCFAARCYVRCRAVTMVGGWNFRSFPGSVASFQQTAGTAVVQTCWPAR